MLKAKWALSIWIQYTLMVVLTLSQFVLPIFPYMLFPMLWSPVANRRSSIGFCLYLLWIMIFVVRPHVFGAIFYTVGNPHHGETITDREVFGGIERLTKYLLDTGKWKTIILIIVLDILFDLVFYGFISFLNGREEDLPVVPLSRLLKMEVPLFLVGLSMIMPYVIFNKMSLFQTAQCVACLEESHGFEKRWWLVMIKGRWKVALGLSALLDSPQKIAISLLALVVLPNEYHMNLKGLELVFFMLIMVILFTAMGLLVQITLMTTWAFFYISCKASHSDCDMDSDKQH